MAKLESEVSAILKKYQLGKDGNNLPTPELVLRRASAIGELKDVQELIKLVDNLNIDAAGPDSGKTALDLASERRHRPVLEFLKHIKKRVIIKELAEGQSLSFQDQDVEIRCDVPRGVKISLQKGNLIIRGSVGEQVSIRLEAPPMVIRHNEGFFMAGYAFRDKNTIIMGRRQLFKDAGVWNNTLFVGGKEFEIPLYMGEWQIKGDLTILGNISSTTNIRADGKVKVSGKALRVLNTVDRMHAEDTIERLLENKDDFYDNVCLFEQALKAADERKNFQEEWALKAAENNKVAYLEVMSRNASIPVSLIESICDQITLPFSETTKKILSEIYPLLIENEIGLELQKQGLLNLKPIVYPYLATEKAGLIQELEQIGYLDFVKTVAHACVTNVEGTLPLQELKQKLDLSKQQKAKEQPEKLMLNQFRGDFGAFPREDWLRECEEDSLTESKETVENIAKIQELIKKGYFKKKKGFSDPSPLMKFAKAGKATYCKLLLESGVADVNFTSAFSRTALTEALERGHIACAEVLLRAGADLEIEGNAYPIMEYAKLGKCEKEFAELLQTLGMKLPVASWNKWGI